MSVNKLRAIIGAAVLACVLSALTVTLFSPSVEAQQQTPIQTTKKRDMKFGMWASSLDGPGTVVISPDADAAVGTGQVFSFGGTVRRARFLIVGQPKAYVFVTLPSSITIARGTSGHVMTVDSFTMDQTNPVRLNKYGKRTINIGATLHVDTNQRKGNYNDANVFTIFVDY